MRQELQPVSTDLAHRNRTIAWCENGGYAVSAVVAFILMFLNAPAYVVFGLAIPAGVITANLLQKRAGV